MAVKMSATVFAWTLVSRRLLVAAGVPPIVRHRVLVSAHPAARSRRGVRLL